MRTATKPTALPTPKRLAGIPNIGPELIVPDVSGVPEPVREAASKAWTSWRVYDDARAARIAAEAEAKAAPEHDGVADRRALEAGEDLPERTEPAKRKALGEANRREKAAADSFRSALYEQAAAMREAYPAWVAEHEAILERRREAIRRKAEELQGEFFGLQTEQELARSLRDFGGQAVSWTYHPPRPEAQGRIREKAGRRARMARKNASVSRDPAALLAAVVDVAEEGR